MWNIFLYNWNLQQVRKKDLLKSIQKTFIYSFLQPFHIKSAYFKDKLMLQPIVMIYFFYFLWNVIFIIIF